MEDGASRPCHTSSGQDIRQPILSPTTGSSYNSTPSKTSSSNISSMSSSEISPASNNSEGKSPSPSEDLQSETDAWEIKLHGNRTRCALLLRAAIIGDWPAAKAFLDKNPEYVRAPITREKSTALHIAATAQHTNFVKELLLSPELKMTPEDLALETTYGFTTLHSAAQSGNVSIAEQLLKVNDKLQFITNCDKEMPLHVAAYLGQKNMVLLLLSDVSFGRLAPLGRKDLLHYTICTDMYDIALQILKMDPTLAIFDNGDGPYGWIALKELAKKPFAIGSESRPSFWKSRLNSWFKGVHNKDLAKRRDNHHQLVDELWKMVQIPEKQFSSNLDRYDVTLIFEAAKVGNVEFLIKLTHSYPDLLWQVDKAQMSIFHIAISCRHESVFNLIYEIGGNMDSLAGYANSETKDNMLHLAGRLAPLHRLNIVSGAALQLQRELLWFKEIERIVPQSCVNKLNSEDKTPKQVFIDEHSGLRKEGEEWMRNTANYSMVVATLIATVTFAVAFTVPGGSNQENDTPIFQKSNWFMILYISDALALCSSTASIIFFLSILTSRYTVGAFFKKLPSKLVLGFATLFFSVVGMMIAFSATCFLVLTRVKAWASFAVVISASIPIIYSFLGLHLKLFVDIYHSTYNSRFLFRPNEYRLFQQKMQGKQKEKKIDRGSIDLEQGRPRKDN